MTPSNHPSSSESDPVFETVSDSHMSRADRYRLLADQWLYAPARIVLSDWRALTGLAILAGFVLVGTVGALYVPPPYAESSPRLVAPFQDWTYPLGTDGLGNDLLSLIVHSTPPMLKMIVAGGLFSTMMATVVGVVSGYSLGRVDDVLMTFNDVSLSIPGFALMIVLGFYFQPTNPYVIGFLLTINAWAGLARSIRSQVLSLRTAEYVEASRTMGLSTPTILTRDVLPNVMPYVMVSFVNSARAVVFNSVGLYFLGALPFSTLNWGVILNQAYHNGALYSWSTVHWLLLPIVALVLLSLGLVLLAQAFDRVFNPRVRARHASSTSTQEDEE